MMGIPARFTVVPFIGPDGAGKTTLHQALGRHVQQREGLPGPPLRTVQVSGSTATVLDARTERGFLQVVDFPSAEVEEALLGGAPVHGAVLVVSAADSVLPGTLRSLTHARELGIRRIAVALTKCDVVEDPEMLDLVTMEVRELLNKHECDGDNAPVVRVGSVPGHHRWVAGVGDLFDAVQRWVP
jgi:translation elongation factor EF-Tu-like GTPase